MKVKLIIDNRVDGHQLSHLTTDQLMSTIAATPAATVESGIITDADGILIDAPCACDECRQNGRVAQGHFQCREVPDVLLKMENTGVIFATYNGTWQWKRA